jgi:hypothetical protein
MVDTVAFDGRDECDVAGSIHHRIKCVREMDIALDSRGMVANCEDLAEIACRTS